MTDRPSDRHRRLIDLPRLVRVLEVYGAAAADLQSEERQALEELHDACQYRPGELVRMRNKRAEQEEGPEVWEEGVVVALMQAEPFYIVGPGDDRQAKFEEGTLFAYPPSRVRLRCSPTEEAHDV